MIHLVYIAAPYRGRTGMPDEIAHNRAIVRGVAWWVTKHGEGILAPVVPHFLTHEIRNVSGDEQYWLDFTMQVCLACPILIKVDGYSDGALAEYNAHVAKYGACRQWTCAPKEDNICNVCKIILKQLDSQ